MINMDDATAREDSPTIWSDYDARGGDEEDLASLPPAVRAIVEECRAQSKQPSTATTAGGAAAEGTGGAAAEEAMPYPCRMYEEAVPGQDDMLQLQWMRVDVRGSAYHCVILLYSEYDIVCGGTCGEIQNQSDHRPHARACLVGLF